MRVQFLNSEHSFYKLLCYLWTTGECVICQSLTFFLAVKKIQFSWNSKACFVKSSHFVDVFLYLHSQDISVIVINHAMLVYFCMTISKGNRCLLFVRSCTLDTYLNGYPFFFNIILNLTIKYTNS
jgi:hypothetical protein